MINSGIWPTMITPFTPGGDIDYSLCERLIAMYDKQGASGIFACCQSSEMFYLTRAERVELTRFVVEHTPSSIDVVASGHVENTLPEQIEGLKRMADTGVRALVLVTNRLAAPDEGDEVFKKNVEATLRALPDVLFGLYECPYPYKRPLTPALLMWLKQTKRFAFIKDTCCEIEKISEKLDVLKGSEIKLFNANTDTLLASLKLGAAGLSGIMANFHADLYVRLYKEYLAGSPLAGELQAFLTLMAMPAHMWYPTTAKYYLSLLGWPIELASRSKDALGMTAEIQERIHCVLTATRLIRETLKEV